MLCSQRRPSDGREVSLQHLPTVCQREPSPLVCLWHSALYWVTIANALGPWSWSQKEPPTVVRLLCKIPWYWVTIAIGSPLLGPWSCSQRGSSPWRACVIPPGLVSRLGLALNPWSWPSLSATCDIRLLRIRNGLSTLFWSCHWPLPLPGHLQKKHQDRLFKSILEARSDWLGWLLVQTPESLSSGFLSREAEVETFLLILAVKSKKVSQKYALRCPLPFTAV